MFKSMLLNDWSDFYQGTPVKHTYNNDSGQKILTDEKIYVFDCFFNNFRPSALGGAIFVNASSDVLIEYSTFNELFSNKTSTAAIYLNVRNSILNKICGYLCITRTKDDGIFCASLLKENSAQYRNEINFSTFSKGYNYEDGDFAVWLNHGNIKASQLNETFNECNYGPAIFVVPAYQENTVTSIFSYSTITNNTAVYKGTIVVLGEGHSNLQHVVTHCNLINNKQKQDRYGVLQLRRNARIESTCLINNVVHYICKEDKFDAKADIIKCYIDKKEMVWVQCQTWETVNEISLNRIDMYKTFVCEAVYDYYGEITIYIPVNHYYSCKGIQIYRTMKLIFISLILPCNC